MRKSLLKITSVVLGAAREFLDRQGFVELLPVILAPITDPLRHTTNRALVKAYGREWHLTRSMIFHKQAAVRLWPRIFSFSPNIRLEPAERGRTGRHLFEFVQLDLEMREASREQVMELGEQLLLFIFKQVEEECSQELAELGRSLPPLNPPFPRITYQQAQQEYGPEFEGPLSRAATTPIWVVDFPLQAREFYDREDPTRPGILLDMDLIYPQGFGEALSGGEREHQPERIRKRILAQGLSLGAYRPLLSLAEEGLPPSAGFGIGIERLVRFIAGVDHVREVRLFPRVPGEVSLL
jgi:asparaginyl-tRNA synthetase